MFLRNGQFLSSSPKDLSNVNRLWNFPNTPERPWRGICLGLLLLAVALGWASSAAAQPACSINPIISPFSYSPAFNRGGTSHADMFTITEYSGDGNRLLLHMTGSATHPGHIDLTGENPDGSSELYLYDIPTETYTQITDSFGADFLDGVRVSGGRSVLSENGDRVFFWSNGNLTGDNPGGDPQAFLYDYPTDTLTQISPADAYSRYGPNGESFDYHSDLNRVVFSRGSTDNGAVYVYDISTGNLLITIPRDPRTFTFYGGMNSDGTALFFWSGNKLQEYDIAADTVSRVVINLGDYPILRHGQLSIGPAVLLNKEWEPTLVVADEIFVRDSTGSLTQVTQDRVFPTIVRPPGVPLTNIPSKDSPPFFGRQMDRLFASDRPRYFFLSQYPERASQEIFLFDAETATLTQLTDSRLDPLAGKHLDFVYVSPDGNTLIFTGSWDSGTDGKYDRTDTFRYDVPTATLTTLFSRGSAPLGNRKGGPRPRQVLSPDTMFLDVGIPLGQGRDQYGFDLEREDSLSSLYRATCSATGSVAHPPAAPAAPQVRAADGQLTVTWSAPADNGSALEDYTVQWKESSFSEWFWEGIDIGRADLRAGGATTYTITGLDNDTAYQVRVRATNAGGWGDWSDAASGTPGAVVDQMPSFGSGTYEATLTVGTPVNLTLPAATGGDGALRYSLSPLPAGLSFNGQTRVLSGTPTTAQAATAATYTVTDSDASNPGSATRTYTITILAADDEALSFGLGAYNATLTVGTPVNLTLPTATGGDGALRYSLSPLPAGLSFNGQTRVLSGTPTTAQDATAATYTVTDSATPTPATDTRPFTLTILTADAKIPGVLENPGDQSAQSGISVLSGWVCEAGTVKFEVNGELYAATYGTERLDTATVCGDTDNGFGMLYNWNRLGDGSHTVRLLVDGQEYATATVRVTTLGQEFRRGLQKEVVLQDFPQDGQDSRLVWQEAQQNFVIAVGPGGGTGSHRDTSKAVLENPAPGSYQSGVRIFSGWACEATDVVLELDGVYRLTAGYGTERPDTATVCGDTNNGFGLLFNWSRLSDGPHTVRLLVDGEVYAQATFAVTTLGAEFRRGLVRQQTIPDFPGPGQSVTVEWQEAQQNFVITAVQ